MEQGMRWTGLKLIDKGQPAGKTSGNSWAIGPLLTKYVSRSCSAVHELAVVK
jgi:hypothetical protein